MLMNLWGLRLMGLRDMSMLCSIRGTMLGPCLGHIRAMFWLFIQYLYFQMSDIAQIFSEEVCIPNRKILFDVNFLGPYYGHVMAILGPCFGYFYNIFAF